MTDELAIKAAATVVNLTTVRTQKIIADYEAGDKPLPGTMADRVVWAYRGAVEALRLENVRLVEDWDGR